MSNENDAINGRVPNNDYSVIESPLNAHAIELLKAQLSTAKENAIREAGEPKTAAEKSTGHKSTKELLLGEGDKDIVLVKEPKDKDFSADKDLSAIKNVKFFKEHGALHTVSSSPWSELTNRHATMLTFEVPITAGLAVGAFLTRNTSFLGSRSMMLGALAVGADVLYRTASTLQGEHVDNVYSDSLKAAAIDFGKLFSPKSHD